MEQTAEALDQLLPRLDGIGVSQAELEALQQSADRLRRSGGQLNAARVEAEYQQVLRQIEKLELQISNNASPGMTGSEWAVRQGEVTDAAAEYYRRLSEQPVRLQR
ncbi:MAG: hypothetical protein HKN42_18165 [Granulosicoccus sp.]|nr:hypothetical protein [Granulosicoccus sp.]